MIRVDVGCRVAFAWEPCGRRFGQKHITNVVPRRLTQYPSKVIAKGSLFAYGGGNTRRHYCGRPLTMLFFNVPRWPPDGFRVDEEAPSTPPNRMELVCSPRPPPPPSPSPPPRSLPLKVHMVIVFPPPPFPFPALSPPSLPSPSMLGVERDARSIVTRLHKASNQRVRPPHAPALPVPSRPLNPPLLMLSPREQNTTLSRDQYGVAYLPGFVGLNNLKCTDFVNVRIFAPLVPVFSTHLNRCVSLL